MMQENKQRLSLWVFLSALIFFFVGSSSLNALEKSNLKRGLRAVVQLVILDENMDVIGTCSDETDKLFFF